ncbi:hypothetical protein Sjap_015302 [Stephania japonica]|uniref:Bulb-type lectin domain-containing protein n=1 Tax=Stephania japonica TaxID=461633 RepID=A0AAP0IJM7_9MAGN
MLVTLKMSLLVAAVMIKIIAFVSCFDSTLRVGFGATTDAIRQGDQLLNSSQTIVSAELWQSFDYPSNHFLPVMKLGFNSTTGKNWSVTSWSSLEDPAPGAFSILLDSSS